jgi:DNA (cytosine-5)-methyltransferase 1
MLEKTYKIVTLFGGCGGLDLGFQGGFSIFDRFYDKHPFEIIWSNDIYKQAVETYRANIGDHVIEGDITEIPNEDIPKGADIVLGGFPCQDFSVAGKRQGINVKRGRLYLELKRVIDHIKPKVFVAENVEGLVNMADGVVLEAIKNDFRESGYRVEHHLLHAVNYGVPQIRKRVFIVGVREDIDVAFEPPIPTHTDNWMTAKEAIDDLWGKENDPTILNHSQISKAKFYPGRKMQGNTRIKADQPSVTIRAEHHGNIEAHYRTFNDSDPEDMQYWRRLSVRECARIQTFPDYFEFKGAATHTYKQIGNAVPPVLGWHVANSVKNVLLKMESNETNKDIEEYQATL